MKSSNYMEKFGLVNALKFLADNPIQVSTLVTDHHKQIAKYMADQILNIAMMCGTYLRVRMSTFITLILHDNECFWLIGVKKKLTHLAKTKKCDLIGDWIKSIPNHLYWCAASAPDGDSDEIVKRWNSLMNHPCNTHDSCYHDPLNSLEERRKMWFLPGSHLTLKLTCY